MKRKVKFQEGGAVEAPSPRSRKLRETMNKMSREGGRLRAAERARERQVAERETARRAAAERALAQREVAQFNARPDVTVRNQLTTDTRIPSSPRPSSVTPVENMPPRRIPEPPRPSTVGTMRGAAAPAMRAGSRLIPGVGALAGMAPTSMEAGAEFEREGLRRVREEAARNQDLDNLRRALPAGPDIEAERAARGAPPASRPAPRPAARPASAPPPRIREMSADELNEMELRRIRAERQMEDDEMRRRAPREEDMGGSGNIGAASARERGEQVGPPGQYNYKKGGMVKKKAGGTIAAKPKAAPAKMKKGGAVAKPKTKAMPFKKGGAVKKGRK